MTWWLATTGLWIILAVTHSLLDHGARDHLAWSRMGRDEYLEEVSGVRGHHLLGVEVAGSLSRRVTFWRGLVVTLVALMGVVVGASVGGLSALLISASSAIALTLGSLGLATGGRWQRTARNPSTLGYVLSCLALGAALWACSESLARFDWKLSVLVSTLALTLTQLPKSAWDIARAADPQSASHLAKGAEVVWLRSFGDDTTRIRSRFGANEWVSFVGIRTRFETLIAACVGRAGAKLVAIGRPGERLRPVGAARTYLPKDDWKQSIEALIMDSRAVLLVVGLSDGLRWEADTLIRLRAVDKTLFILPPLYFSRVEERVEAFLGNLGVPLREVSEVDWEMPTLLGFYVASTGHVGVIMGDGRDDMNYALMIERFLTSLTAEPLPSFPSLSSYANFANETLESVEASGIAWDQFSRRCQDIILVALDRAALDGRTSNSRDLWLALIEDDDVTALLADSGVQTPAAALRIPPTHNPLEWYSRFEAATPNWRQELTQPRVSDDVFSLLESACELASPKLTEPEHLLRAMLAESP